VNPACSEDTVYCMTSDLDWAPDWAVSALADRLEASGLRWTPFVTHRSAEIEARFGAQGLRRRVGLHPSFLPGSTHGGSVDEVIDHCRSLWPQARSFRSHSFVDSTPIAMAFASRGFDYDSNLCLFLQAGIVPLSHCSGLIRFPVFWEDDIHYKRGLPCTLESLRPHLDSPGLKILNIHPLLYALNVPDLRFYQAHKHLVGECVAEKALREAFAGDGIRTLVDALIEFVGEKGYRCASLDELYQEYTGRG